MKEFCPICKSTKIINNYFRSRKLKINVCKICGLGWIESFRQSKGYFTWSKSIYNESNKRKKMYVDRIKWIEGKVNIFPKVWLDIGCAGGGMLKVAKNHGYRVEGIEPGKKAAEYVSKELNVKIHPSILTDAKLRYSKYGVISYFHVMEHIADPVKELAIIRKYLHDCGILVIEVPNFGTLSWKLLGKGHRHITEAHLFYYNKVSLSNLLENNGFEVLLIRNVPYFISLSWFFYRMSFKIFMANKILLKFSDYIRSIKIVIRSDLKDVLMVVARKAKGK